MQNSYWIENAISTLRSSQISEQHPNENAQQAEAPSVPLAETPSISGRNRSDDQFMIAADGASSRGRCQYLGEPLQLTATPMGDLLGRIVEDYRRRQDMIRARTRIELQAQSVCRRRLNGDKVAAIKLWSDVKRDKGHELRVWLGPYIAAMAPLEQMQAEIEATLAKLVKELPVYSWIKGLKGVGSLGLSAVVGECVHPVGSYKSVAAVWKRMGLAVIGHERQRRIIGDAALLHGYSPDRRAVMWNIGSNILKAQIRKDPNDDEARVALGELGALYLERKAYEIARGISKAHAHNRAQRYIEKRFLRDLYREWRRCDGIIDEQTLEAEAVKLPLIVGERDAPIASLKLSVRAMNRIGHLSNVGALCELHANDLHRIPGMGKGTVAEIERALFGIGLSLRKDL